MKTTRVLFTTLTFIIWAGIFLVNAAPSDLSVATQPWKVDFLQEEVDGIRNLSTAFVGKYQTPMVSYSRAGSHHIYMGFLLPPNFLGGCGPDDSWYCPTYSTETDLIAGTLSNLATMPKLETYLTGWAFSTGSMIRGVMSEWDYDQPIDTMSSQDLIQLSKFGGILVGAPSLQIVDGNYRLAATIRNNEDIPTHKLVYMYYIGNFNNSSCKIGGFGYQCDVIEESIGSHSMGAPSLQVATDGTVGIAYYNNGIKYAYPHTHTIFKPSNCGPGDPQTWRCISIRSDFVMSDVVKFAFGSTSSDIGIVFTYDDETILDTLGHARYVGSGGNCGREESFPIVKYAWECSDVAFLGDLPSYYTPSYSIAVDPDGYSVIAFDYALQELSPINLYIAYPNARIGDSSPGWNLQEIDSGYDQTFATGAQAAISLDDAGLGFISYLQQEDYEVDDLKIALQLFDTYLPMILR